MAREITYEVATIFAEARSRLILEGLIESAVITEYSIASFLYTTLDTGVITGEVLTESIKHNLYDDAFISGWAAGGNRAKRITEETGRIFSASIGTRVLYAATTEEALLNSLVLSGLAKNILLDNAQCSSSSFTKRLIKWNITDVALLHSVISYKPKTVITDTAVATSETIIVVTQRVTTLEGAAVHGVSTYKIVCRSPILDSGIITSRLGARGIIAKGRIIDMAYITSILPIMAPIEFGTRAWVINVRNWYMGEYRGLPVKEIGSKYGTSPNGLYVRTPGYLAAESYIETGDLNLIAGSDFNVHTIYMMLHAEHSELDILVTASQYGREVVIEYDVPVLVSTKERNRIVRLSRKVDGNAWKFRIGSLTGHWGITNMSLEIGRNRVPKK